MSNKKLIETEDSEIFRSLFLVDLFYHKHQLLWIKLHISFGTSVFGQLIPLIKPSIISNVSHKHKSDRYVKKFTTKDHLISMLFSSFAKCSSLREVSGTMLGLSGENKILSIEAHSQKEYLIRCKYAKGC